MSSSTAGIRLCPPWMIRSFVRPVTNRTPSASVARSRESCAASRRMQGFAVAWP
jgi:hypothetical protein